MSVEGCVGGALERGGDGATEEDGVDFVGDVVCFVFIEGQHYEGVVCDVRIVEKGREVIAGPRSGERDVRIVAIVCHVGRDEGPLRQRLTCNVRGEGREVLDKAEAGGVGGYRVEQNERVVLADIIVRIGLLVGVIEALKSRVR